MSQNRYFRRVALNEMRRTKDTFFRGSLLLKMELTMEWFVMCIIVKDIEEE